MTPTELVLAKLPDARPAGNGWSVRCPAHDDRRASLSVGVGDDGRYVLHCHAGCKPEDVVRALGLRWADLMPERAPSRNGRTAKPRATTYATADVPIASLERQHGEVSSRWTYTDGHGEPVGVVLRYLCRACQCMRARGDSTANVAAVFRGARTRSGIARAVARGLAALRAAEV